MKAAAPGTEGRNARVEGEAWVEAGLAELASGGVEAVRVEVVAQRLGVTKGGFYRRFKDRRALLDAMLESWAAGRIATVERQTALGEMEPADRLRSLIKLFVERANAQGFAIEIAIRQWAQADQAAAAAVARVDAARLATVVRLYELMGQTPSQASARGVLLYAFLFGQGLLHIPKTKRASLMSACADLLTAP